MNQDSKKVVVTVGVVLVFVIIAGIEVMGPDSEWAKNGLFSVVTLIPRVVVDLRICTTEMLSGRDPGAMIAFIFYVYGESIYTIKAVITGERLKTPLARIDYDRRVLERELIY